MTPMVVECSSCLTEFELDSRKVPPDGVRARCSVCSAVIVVPAPRPDVENGELRRQDEQEQQDKQPQERNRQEQEQAQRHEQQLHEQQLHEHGESQQREQQQVAAKRVREDQDQQEEDRKERERKEAESQLQEQQEREQQEREQQARHEHEGERSAQKQNGAQGESAPPAARRPINPFLARDPSLRAKRLARALVSDIVAYHPARHAEGLRDGTLKTLFRDDIRKSYEEYVDQVGRDFASSTTYFQDALNDVLAGGKKLF